MSGFILFCTSVDEATMGNESCRNPASNWMSMRAGEITWPWCTMKCLKTIPVAWKIPAARKSMHKCMKWTVQMIATVYKAVKPYLSKLNPKSSAFFQYTSRNWVPSDPVWYDNKPLGINKLDNMMKDFSQAVQLSRVYTNHSVSDSNHPLVECWSP